MIAIDRPIQLGRERLDRLEVSIRSNAHPGPDRSIDDGMPAGILG